MRVAFSESAAPLKNIKTVLTAGIEISPAVAGTWFWLSDKELQFTPKDDWPVDGEFSVRFARRDFVAGPVLLDRYRFTFKSQPFAARISESQFYQDPRNPNLKKLVATVTFTHPVDPERFESRVALAVAKDAEYLGLSPDSRHFTVAYDKFKLNAYVHSAALAMPRDDTPMTLQDRQGRARGPRRQRHWRSPAGRRHDSRAAPACASPTPAWRWSTTPARARTDPARRQLVAGGGTRLRRLDRGPGAASAQSATTE